MGRVETTQSSLRPRGRTRRDYSRGVLMEPEKRHVKGNPPGAPVCRKPACRERNKCFGLLVRIGAPDSPFGNLGSPPAADLRDSRYSYNFLSQRCFPNVASKSGGRLCPSEIRRFS